MLFKKDRPTAAQVVPVGLVRILRPEDILPSPNNPRHLFDPEPLASLKDNIREHGVLVPITVYQPAGQDKFFILDGQRRHRCCVELVDEGFANIGIPANIVAPPSKIASLLYMFNIHNYREQWELMPTALGLREVIEELGEQDSKALVKLTGLSGPQVERCKLLLSFPDQFQAMSLDPNPSRRVPSNFWIEIFPVLGLAETLLPELLYEFKRDGLTEILVNKYLVGVPKSVIHFREVMLAYNLAESPQEKAAFINQLRRLFVEADTDPKRTFEPLVGDNRRIRDAVGQCGSFVSKMKRLKVEYVVERDELIRSLREVAGYVNDLLERLAGEDAPSAEREESEL